jgi:hypothetical protein
LRQIRLAKKQSAIVIVPDDNFTYTPAPDVLLSRPSNLQPEINTHSVALASTEILEETATNEVHSDETLRAKNISISVGAERPAASAGEKEQRDRARIMNAPRK